MAYEGFTVEYHYAGETAAGTWIRVTLLYNDAEVARKSFLLEGATPAEQKTNLRAAVKAWGRSVAVAHIAISSLTNDLED